jgi:hypothetical protein
MRHNKTYKIPMYDIDYIKITRDYVYISIRARSLIRMKIERIGVKQ